MLPALLHPHEQLEVGPLGVGFEPQNRLGRPGNVPPDGKPAGVARVRPRTAAAAGLRPEPSASPAAPVTVPVSSARRDVPRALGSC